MNWFQRLVAALSAALSALLSLASCNSTPVSEMDDLEFQALLVDVQNDTATLAMGWLSEHESDVDELQAAIALLRPSGGTPITPEELQALESQGLVGALISVAAGNVLEGVGDSERWRQILGAFVDGLEVAVVAATG